MRKNTRAYTYMGHYSDKVPLNIYAFICYVDQVTMCQAAHSHYVLLGLQIQVKCEYMGQV
jgi:hypothetical protein